MKWIVVFLTMFVCSQTLADNLAPGTSMFYSEDSDGNIVSKISAELWYDQEPRHKKANQHLGVQYTRVEYQNNQAQYQGQGLGIVVDDREGKTWIMGQASMISLDDHDYIASDIGVMRFLGDNMILNAGVYSDIVDSPLGLIQGTTLYGAYVGAEIYNDLGGIALNHNRRWMSDDNSREYWITKSYVNLPQGFHIYLATEDFRTQKFSDIYWSPRDFARRDIGLGFRRRWQEFLLTGSADVGDTNIDGYSEYVSSWHLSAERNIHKRFRIGGRIGRDITVFNYDYNYLTFYMRLAM